MITASGTDIWSGLMFLAGSVATVTAIVLVVWLIARRHGTTASLAVRAAAAFAGVWLALAAIGVPFAIVRLVRAPALEVAASTGESWDAYCVADAPNGASTLLCEGSRMLATGVTLGPRLLVEGGVLSTSIAMAAPALALFVLCRRALQNSVFPASIPRLLLVCGATTLVFGSLAPILAEMGNGLAAAEVLPSEVPVTYLFTVPWWPALVALACAALAAIFRHGARLQRDTEGLV